MKNIFFPRVIVHLCIKKALKKAIFKHYFSDSQKITHIKAFISNIPLLTTIKRIISVFIHNVRELCGKVLFIIFLCEDIK
jgi:hypothetical protein